MAFEWNITHESKHVPWAGTTTDGDILYLGLDYSAAAFVMAFAATEGGSPVITLTNAAAGSQGVSATYDAAVVNPETGAVVGGTTIRPFITEATLEALTWGGDASAPLVLHFDFLITPSGGTQFVLCSGTFTIKPGVGD